MSSSWSYPCEKMHELPKELSNSLRSWRGSVYRHSGQHEPIDLEKLETSVDDHGEKQARYTQVSLHSVRLDRSTYLQSYLANLDVIGVHGITAGTRSHDTCPS